LLLQAPSTPKQKLFRFPVARGDFFTRNCVKKRNGKDKSEGEKDREDGMANQSM
jgi:hypothetical protein